MPAARPDGRSARSAIGRSLDIYYRDGARTARMTRLYADFVTPGALVFDIGAHLGDRTGCFLGLGASVVALEPQPRVFRALRLLHGRAPDAVLLQKAAGDRTGTARLHLNAGNPTVSTVSRRFMAAARGAPGWQTERWDDHVTVEVTTIDTLIARYGVPDFVKIDVEGHEHAVLEGTRIALPALSFEFTTIQRPLVAACVGRLRSLGRYAFNFSLGEEHALRHGTWLDADALLAEIDGLPKSANSGDIYARRL